MKYHLMYPYVDYICEGKWLIGTLCAPFRSLSFDPRPFSHGPILIHRLGTNFMIHQKAGSHGHPVINIQLDGSTLLRNWRRTEHVLECFCNPVFKQVKIRLEAKIDI